MRDGNDFTVAFLTQTWVEALGNFLEINGLPRDGCGLTVVQEEDGYRVSVDVLIPTTIAKRMAQK